MISATATRHLFAALKSLHEEKNPVEFKTSEDWVKCNSVSVDNSNENLTLTLHFEAGKKLQILHYARTKLLFQITEMKADGRLNITAARAVSLRVFNGDVLRIEML